MGVNKVKKIADKKVKAGILDNYYVVENYASEALNYFEIEKESFGKGYYYSIAELVSFYLCTTDYLFYFSSDSFIHNNAGDWISNAITIFKNRKDIIVANPTWNFAFQQAKNESIEELKDFYLGYGFSDQCYLIKTDIFKNKIYNETHPESERYPKDGGELFEKRVDAFMRSKKLFRITSKDVSYIYVNFPSQKIWKSCRDSL